GVMFGGITPKRHIKVIKREPDVLVSTPGRLFEFIEHGHLSLDKIEMFVLDEVDQMLDVAMLKTVKSIIEKLPKSRQNLVFSATMPKVITKLVNGILKNPVKINAEVNNADKVEITQYVYSIEEPDKTAALIAWLKENTYESVLVFVRTKSRADKVSKAINIANIRNKAIHGDKSQTQRQRALQMFKDGEIKVLIATDVAARGIDIEKLSHVVNVNIPNVPETYIHRIGRTGRAGKKGTAISFCSKEEIPFLAAIEKKQKQALQTSFLES
ncbi:MAG: DEAD/DEAH box helicase, partial [Bacilli bacterium]